jgi:hypothetical protein
MVGKSEMIFMARQASMPVFLHVRQKEGRKKKEGRKEGRPLDLSAPPHNVDERMTVS